MLLGFLLQSTAHFTNTKIWFYRIEGMIKIQIQQQQMPNINLHAFSKFY